MARPKLIDVPGIGQSTARLLARNGIRTVAALAEAPLDDIAAVPGFGPVRAKIARTAAIEVLGGPAKRAASPKPMPVSPPKPVTPAIKRPAAASAGATEEDGAGTKAKKKKKKKHKKDKKRKKDKAKTKARNESPKSKGKKKKQKGGKKKDGKKGKKKGKKK
jgi:hypothetical protein